MAEFKEVLHQLNRMCSHMPDCSKSGCPIFYECGNVAAYSSKDKVMRVEKIVMQWAAEHPEQKYPTWRDYIVSIMIKDIYNRDDIYPKSMVQWMNKTHISADIAEKLGIKPKEVI